MNRSPAENQGTRTEVCTHCLLNKASHRQSDVAASKQLLSKIKSNSRCCLQPHRFPFIALVAALISCYSFLQVNAIADGQLPLIKPTVKDVAYGDHPRQKLDFYAAVADASGKCPVVIHVHGGGWVRGDKAEVPFLKKLLDQGLSVVSINYRFTWQAQKSGVMPPVSWPLADAARAVQFVRSRADEWGIDTSRIGMTGGSAGGCSSLYVAFSDDLAQPDSPDPVNRQSTRLTCAAVNIAQTSLDPAQMKAWIPNNIYGGHAFGFMDPDNLSTRDTQFSAFLANRPKILPWIDKYSPWQLVSPSDPPIFLAYGRPPTDASENVSDPTHSANFGVELQKRCKQFQVECHLVHPGATSHEHKDIPEFLAKKLLGPATPPNRN